MCPGRRFQDGSSIPFQDAIVFVIGGGNYTEYQNLMSYATSSSSGSKSSSANLSVPSAASSKRIIYGCSTLVSPNQMLEEFAALGHEM